MSANLTRRGFLGLLGGALVVAAAPGAIGFSFPHARRPQTDGSLFELLFSDLVTPGFYGIKRAESDHWLMRVGLSPQGYFRWFATPEGAIRLTDGTASVQMVGDGPFTWHAGWIESQTGVRHFDRGTVT